MRMRRLLGVEGRGRGVGGEGRGRGVGGEGRNIVCFGCLAVTRGGRGEKHCLLWMFSRHSFFTCKFMYICRTTCIHVPCSSIIYMHMYMEIHVHGILALKTGTCQLKKSVCLCLE